MAKDQTVAPKERVNITYKPATGDAKEEIELPLRTLVIGDFTGRADPRPIEERKTVDVDKDGFDEVLAAHEVRFEGQVPDLVRDEPGAEMSVRIDFRSMRDFGPEAIAEQIPELQKLLSLRTALTALKGPLGNIPTFKKKLEGLVADGDARAALAAELGLDRSTDPSE
jgi:type VI secretion system protein ImpB